MNTFRIRHMSTFRIRQFLSGAVAVLAVSASAVDAVFDAPSAPQAQWALASNWKDAASGAPLAEPPTNAADTVTFPCPDKAVYLQRIGIGTGETTSERTDVSVRSVVGDGRHVLCNGFSWQEGNPRREGARGLTVENPNGFSGSWFAGDAHAVFRFPGTASFVPQVSELSVNARPEVDVPAAGTKAEIGVLYNGGALTKLGAGDLSVAGTSGADVRVYVEDGGLVLPGQDGESQLDGLLARAALHLDASVPETRQEVAAGDRTCVTKWEDVRGNGLSATVPAPIASRIPEVNPPSVAAGASDSRLDMLDFGSRAGSASGTAFGPANCLMAFPQLENCREAFYVARYHEKPVFNAVLGARDVPTLQPASRLLGGSANYGARTGFIFANGVRVDARFWPSPDGKALGTGDGMTNQYVMSFGSASNMVFSTIASDGYYSEQTGGMLVGEILLFTNELTRAERVRVNAYLHGKWSKRAPAREADFGQVVVKKAGSALGVADGKTSRVLDVVAASGALVKTGGGTLEADALYPSDAAVVVRGGAVRFGRLAPIPASPAPAADPAVHLDASVASSYATATPDGDTRAFVTEWRDCDGRPVAAAPTLDYSRKPTLARAVSATGLDAIDFQAAGPSFVKFPWWGDTTPRFRAGFAVVRQVSAALTYVPYFGSKNMTFMREGVEGGVHGRFVSENYSHPGLASAVWTLDGVPTDPYAYTPRLKETSTFMVVAFSGREKVLVDAIAVARNNDDYSGGMQVGEFLLYDRELTDGERRATEAYLMKKWLGAEHPAAATPQPALTFAEDVRPVLDFESDAVLANVSGGNGDLVKRGAGAVTLAKPPADVRTLTVEAGSLSVPVPECFLDEALFHFDAQDEASLVYGTDEAYGRHLAQWADVRGNGVVADSVRPDDPRARGDASGSFVKALPARVDVETAAGVTRPFLYFGSVLGGDSAAMWMNRAYSTVREAYTVHKDKGRNSLFFSCTDYGPCKEIGSHWDFFRPTSGMLCGDGASPHVRDGTFWLNGVAVENPLKTEMPTAPALVGIRATGDTHVNSIQEDRGVPGGAWVGEQVAFSRTLTDRERDYLQDLLMHKWFADRPRPAWTNAFYSSVSVASGATLRLDGGDAVVTALAGAGTIDAVGLQGVAALDVSDASGLTVTGACAFSGRVTVTLPALADVKCPVGDYPVLSAASFEGLDLASWSFAGTLHRTRRFMGFHRRGNTIYARIGGCGLMLIVR